MTSVIPFRPPQAVCRFGYTSEQVVGIFGELASDGDRIFPVPHAYQRMDQREVTFSQVLRILRRGALTEGPALTQERLWRMKYRGDSAGQDISVVVDIDQDQMGNMIAVVTVIVH
jgi:Domain of unknown function (DUF4258)